MKTKEYYIGCYALLPDGTLEKDFVQFGGSVGLPDFEYKTLKNALKSFKDCPDENISERGARYRLLFFKTSRILFI